MNNLAYELEKLITNGSRKYPMPYKKGNSIRLGKVVIRAKQDGYILFDCEQSEQICMTDSKYGALAAAKKYQKHKNDTAFYKHVMKNASTSLKKEIAGIRLDVSEAYQNNAVYDLETIIFD